MQRIHKIWLGVAFVTCAGTGIAVAQNSPQNQDQQQQPQPSQPPGGMQGQDTEGAQGAQGAQGTQQQGMQAGTVMAEKKSATATVDKLDKKKRKITLKNEEGNTVTVHVPESVSRLDAIKKGDKVQIDYYESVALSLMKPEKGKTGARETTMTERTPGQLPGGLMARKMTETVTVMKVDKDNNEVTIKSPSGDTSTVKVDPSMSDQLEKIKQGDRIKASYTEAIALSVMPEEKQGQQGHQGRESGQQQRSKGGMQGHQQQQEEQQQPKGY